MRVISGCARGAKLLAPDGLNTRPTTDRIKETLFNIIAFELNRARVLDLFCGSGALGIEALSRGSEFCVFVDNDKNSIKTLEHNLKHTKIIEKSKMIFDDCDKAISTLGKAHEKFDIIFLDPPYYKDYTIKTINDIILNDILKYDGIIVAEQGGEEVFLQSTALQLYKLKKYKTTNLVFYRYGGDNG